VSGVDLTDTFTAIEVLGIAAGAAAGALDAKRREEFDVFGLAALAFAGGLGGGLLRDLLIGSGSPAAFTAHSYLPIVIVVAFVVAVVPGHPGRRAQTGMRFLDALSIGAFAVVAADKANFAGFTILGCLFLGVVGGVGGLLMRDVLTASTPEIFRRGELNGIAAMAAAAVFIALLKAGVERPVPAVAGIAVGFVLRGAALRYGLLAPAPRR
jgi:uncharacterized membrane protein YeiH